MEGYGFLLFLVLAIAIVLALSGIGLKKILPPEKAVQTIAMSFASLLLASIAVVIISLFIGGWEGMGYGILGICALIGTVVGSFMYAGLSYFIDRRKSKNEKVFGLYRHLYFVAYCGANRFRIDTYFTICSGYGKCRSNRE